MSSKAPDIVRSRTVKVYNLKEFENLINGIQVAACMITESHQIVDEQSVIQRLNSLTFDPNGNGNCCSCCGVGPFESRTHQIAHYKNHWHTHNLKRKLFGKEALSLGQFNSKGDDSSVSGSDSETEGNSTKPASELFAAATRHCKAFYTNNKGQVFCVYRCILHHRKEVLSTDGEGIAWVDRVMKIAMPLYQRWAVLMVSGGHFAGAIFAGETVVVHKTFHSYVSRRGQGQAQVNRDNHAAHAPRSAGASLRRYNQQHFLERVQEIVASWAQDLDTCKLVLYRAVGSTNQGAIFGKNSPLNRDDLRVRQLPFPTKKPTYKEVKRVHEIVASIEVYETMELFQKALIASKANSKSSTDVTAGNKKTQRISPTKPINRAKSRERTPRELPTTIISSEDEGPCYIDSETPADWIKTLHEQSINGVITNSRKDLLLNVPSVANSEVSEEETKNVEEKKGKKKKKRKKEVKQDEGKADGVEIEGVEDGGKKEGIDKKIPQKIPAHVKKLWKTITDNAHTSLETILESFEAPDLDLACNTQDPTDGNTALHKAAIAEKTEMVTELLTAGSNPCIKNNLLQTPYAAATQTDTRIAFRMFQAQHPDKYNYSKSQIPGPLTPELLEQERERKLQMKRLKRQREKEKQAEKNKLNQFMLMNDAAKIKANIPRCFLCGSLLPKTPFDYESFKFCTIKCLQNHRNLRPLNKTA